MTEGTGMSPHPSRLEGGAYDGDEADIGYWPDSIVAWRCSAPACAQEIHWSVVPADLIAQELGEARESGVEALLYVRDRQEKEVMIYTWQRLLEGATEEALAGVGASSWISGAVRLATARRRA